MKGVRDPGSETRGLITLPRALCSVTVTLIHECGSVSQKIDVILKRNCVSSQRRILRSPESCPVFVCLFCFYFSLFSFTLDKKTKLGTFLIGFPVFIFKLCFPVHLICTDFFVIMVLFNMFVLIRKSTHLKTASFQYFYSSLVAFRILCTHVKENF